VSTHHDFPDIPELQPRRVPARFATKLEPDLRRRLGIDREPIDWGEVVVCAVVAICLLSVLVHVVLG
jgi:hypothetical protein